MYKFFAQDIHGNLLVYLGAVHWQACLVAGRYFIAGAWRGYDICHTYAWANIWACPQCTWHADW